MTHYFIQYTKGGLWVYQTRVARMKVVYESGKVECGTILNLVTLATRAGYAMMIEVSPK